MAWVPHSGQRHHPHLRIRAPLGATGLRPPEVRGVLLAARHIEDRAVDRHQPPPPIPGTSGLLGRQRPGNLGEQRLQRLRLQLHPRPRDRRRTRHLPRARPALRPGQTLHEQPRDLLMVLPREQAHRQHEIDHHPRRQQPSAQARTAALSDHPVHQLGRKRACQQSVGIVFSLGIGTDFHTHNLDPGRKSRDLARRLKALGHGVTLIPAAA